MFSIVSEVFHTTGAFLKDLGSLACIAYLGREPVDFDYCYGKHVLLIKLMQMQNENLGPRYGV